MPQLSWPVNVVTYVCACTKECPVGTVAWAGLKLLAICMYLLDMWPKGIISLP